ncbi:MAG TPA: hypothetical protein VLB29_01285 [Nocardioidaceae bacterium]|nr:hypothetical protein [Nocardioidaceae bacterium]
MPRDLADVVPDEIEGADTLREVLVSMLERCGHRARQGVGAQQQDESLA